ncbi:MAG: type II secretion system protein GspM [Casimicrobiaceae bacterium]
MRVFPDSVNAWWRMKTRRERGVVAALGIMVAAVLAWALVVDPLARDTVRLQRDRDDAQRALAQGRLDAAETARLARAPLPPPADGHVALDAALARGVLRAALTSIEWRGRDARLTFASVAFDAIVPWLEKVHRETGFAVREATLSSLGQPGMVRAELVLAR